MKSYLGRDNQACSSSIRTESKDGEGNKERGGNRGEKRNTKETQCEETEAEASLPAAAAALIITAGDKAD